MRLLVSGSRYLTDISLVEQEILALQPSVIIHGGCTGADLLAEKVAKKHSIPTEVYLPDWRMGKSAGPIRNQKMIDSGRPDTALLFLSEGSRGTLDMLNRVIKHGIPYRVVNVTN